jgi:hypothetical protein
LAVTWASTSSGVESGRGPALPMTAPTIVSPAKDAAGMISGGPSWPRRVAVCNPFMGVTVHRRIWFVK